MSTGEEHEQPDAPLPRARVASHLGVMAAVAAIMGLLTAGLVIPFVGAIGLGAKEVSDGMRNFPAELETGDLAQKTVVLDRNGKQIATFFDQNRVNVSLSQVSPTMREAIIAIEDYRFYQHGALDLKGTLRALLKNKAAGGDVVQGGSSITQQTVKQTLLSNAGSDPEKIRAATDDTYERKIRELRYAIALERKHSKDWILERYLNIAYFGDGAYGIQAAARHYFSVNASKLDLNQSAMLAGLVKNPVGYDPTRYPDKAVERRDTVLNRMAELNAITEAERDAAKAQPIPLKVKRTNNGCVDTIAPFFCDYVQKYLVTDARLGATPEERWDFIKTGGLTIHTTLDQSYQRSADASVSSHVNPTDLAIGGLALVEPGTGAVRALSQSRPMGRKVKLGQTYLNYVVPKKYGDANGFQAGSTFKAFTLAAALTRGVPLDYQFNSPEPVKVIPTEFEMCNGRHYTDTKPWEPQNATSNGLMDLYRGTRLSVNTFYVQLELTTGLCAPYEMAKSMGIQLAKKDRVREMTPTFTLGTVDVSPLEMAEAYATFAARGKHCPATPVTRIEDAEGNVVQDYKPQCSQVMPEGAADGVNAVLRGVQEPGGFGYNNGLSISVPSAGKTGTTQDSKSVWFCGYTPQLAGAAMIAGANSEGQPIGLDGLSVGGRTVYGASGSSFAGPIWGDAFEAIQDSFKWEDFVSPDLSDITTEWTQVPGVRGMSLEAAAERLREAGFRPLIGPAGGRGPVGTVAKIFPSGEAVEGSAILLTPAKGPKKHRNPGQNGEDGEIPLVPPVGVPPVVTPGGGRADTRG
ncbi:MAG: transglycosylase domain-containing protein [Nocardioides sp.]